MIEFMEGESQTKEHDLFPLLIWLLSAMKDVGSRNMNAMIDAPNFIQNYLDHKSNNPHRNIQLDQYMESLIFWLLSRYSQMLTSLLSFETTINEALDSFKLPESQTIKRR